MHRIRTIAGHVVDFQEPAGYRLTPMPTAALSGISGSIAVITGGAQGIGLQIAQHLGKLGAQLCLIDMNGPVLEKAAATLAKDGMKAKGYQCDVTSESSVAQCFKSIIDDNKKVDILVQAAGITGKTNVKTHEVELDNFEHVFKINSTGVFLCARAVLPSMIKQNYGRIVNIASVSGKEGNAGMLAYSSSKAAVIGQTKVMGKEYAETGITINCVAPAVVQTAMVDAMPPEQVKYMTDKIPMKRTCLPEEVANLVCFIASKEASFTTAFCFDVTGGRSTY